MLVAYNIRSFRTYLGGLLLVLMLACPGLYPVAGFVSECEFEIELVKYGRALAGPRQSADFKILLISDLNESYGSTSYGPWVDDAMARIASDYLEHKEPDLVICAGDMVAGQKRELTEEQLFSMWRSFGRHILMPLQSMNIPFAFTLGNHDASSGRGFELDREVALSYWLDNKPELNYSDDSNFPFYYSFMPRDDIFIASLNASGAWISPKQREWLKRELSSRQAVDARFRIVLGHLPLYAVAQGRNRQGEIIDDAENLLRLMSTYDVDYYISGHHHAFYIAEKMGVKMIFTGALGAGPRRYIGCDRPPKRTMTWLDLYEGQDRFIVTTVDMHDEMREMRLDELPERIIGFTGYLYRYE